MGKETDSIFTGKYSFTNFVRSKGKKDDGDPNSERKGDQNPEGKIDNQDRDNKNYKNLKKRGESSEVEDDENLKKLLDTFKDAAKDRPGLFERFEKPLKDAYEKIQNKSYQLCTKDNTKNQVAMAVINFIAGKKVFETDLEVTELTPPNNVEKGSFSVQCGDACAFLVCRPIDGLLGVVFNMDAIVRF